MWSGSLDPGHALILAEQLKLIPDSRTRASWLGNIEYIGWSPLTYVLANLWDLVQSAVYSFAGKKMPANARYPRPEPPKQEVSSIAEFNIEAFMRQLNS